MKKDKLLRAVKQTILEKKAPPLTGEVARGAGGVVKINNLTHIKTFRKRLRKNLVDRYRHINHLVI